MAQDYFEEWYDRYSPILEGIEKCESSIEAVRSSFAGEEEPEAETPYQWWGDETTKKIKIRDESDTWVDVFDVGNNETILQDHLRKGSLVKDEAIEPLSCTLKTPPSTDSKAYYNGVLQGIYPTISLSDYRVSYKEFGTYLVYFGKTQLSIAFRFRAANSEADGGVQFRVDVEDSGTGDSNVIQGTSPQWTDEISIPENSTIGWKTVAVQYITSGVSITTRFVSGITYRAQST